MTKAHLAMLAAESKKLEQAGLYRPETIHAAHIVDFTSQDYLGLTNDPRLVSAARAALDAHGLGAGSSRVFAGTREIHRDLEQAVARFLQVPDAIVLGSGYLANLGFYEALFDSRDCLFCDALVHPSTAEGIRLSSATAFPFHNNDAEDLEDKLKRSRSARFRAIVTDGVFPFDGRVAELDGICSLAAKYDAMVVLDDSLGIGALGETGRGARELRGTIGQVDVVTGTFGKALGGAGGGFIAGRREIIAWLRQKATPYLFSIALAPPLAAAARAALEILERGEAALATLRNHIAQMKRELEARGFKVLGGEHPTLAVFVGSVVALQKMVNSLYERGIHVHGLCYPVVPEGQARIRLEITARHTVQDLGRAINAFDLAGRAFGVI
ncbi:MAG TPA: aminotransferase class I/II-fold pyridoxal phosphate-dependent enzyme [Kofleriaceae bacterium]|jgi:glycine C-acetyltransferase|nr:aminotransferase class I/II-fold pyridoxal phosphate-dependent enzyme [Kofleriaceae bacterium]